jgi:hypothetical protein
MELISRTKGLDFGGELKIVNRATVRSVEEKEGREKERRKREGSHILKGAESRQPSCHDTINI